MNITQLVNGQQNANLILHIILINMQLSLIHTLIIQHGGRAVTRRHITKPNSPFTRQFTRAHLAKVLCFITSLITSTPKYSSVLPTFPPWGCQEGGFGSRIKGLSRNLLLLRCSSFLLSINLNFHYLK